MKLQCCSFEEMKKRIEREHAKIILFGAGAIGQVTTPEILKNYGLMNYVECYIDNNRAMHGSILSVSNKYLEIRSPEYLKSCKENTVIILNTSRFSDVLEQLESTQCTATMSCYIMPMMLIHNFCSSASENNLPKGDKFLIPKKLHYMWLGGKPISDSLKKCMESWHRFCPNYEIIEWNENNYDIEKHPYMKQAYETGAYGFVPDYARLDILYNEGGIYLDTDVEIKRNIDDLLYQEAFCGVEKWQLINFGGMSGAMPGHSMVKRFLDAREDVMFLEKDGIQNRKTCGFYDTKVAIEFGYKLNGKVQSIDGMTIYPYDYFQPYDYMSGVVNETNNTYSIHWFNGGWLDYKMKMSNQETRCLYLITYKKALNSAPGGARF